MLKLSIRKKVGHNYSSGIFDDFFSCEIVDDIISCVGLLRTYIVHKGNAMSGLKCEKRKMGETSLLSMSVCLSVCLSCPPKEN